MKGDIYVLTSPDYPSNEDFRNFSVWCQWHEAEEVPYLESLCDSEAEYQSEFIEPYEKGKESFYPIIENPIPSRVFLFIYARISINHEHSFTGYLSTDGNEVIAIHIWVNPDLNQEVTILSDTRLFAEDENPKALNKLKDYIGSKSNIEISYKTDLVFSNGENIHGTFILNKA